VKSKTFDQIEAMRQKAVRFLRDVVGDSDKAEEFDLMSPSDYAEHKRIRMIENPASKIHRRSTTTMARKTYAELQEEVKDLKEENSDLSDRLDTILDIVSPQDDDEDEDDEDEDDEDDDEGE
jgi:hypothetical protein